jgi:protein-S-isoprenylcysteine O-methyltransferase Ste14
MPNLANKLETIMLKKILYAIGNLTGILLFTLLCVATYQKYQQTHEFLTFSLIMVNGLILALYFIRHEPKALIKFPFAWLISIVATLLPFLYRPSELVTLPELLNLGRYLQMFGMVAMIGSLLSLRDSLGIVPANRGIKSGGFYRYVRHPLYTSELIFFTGYSLSNQSIANGCLLLLLCALQYCRSKIEENFLLNDQSYHLYMSRTPYRFIPGVL